MKTNRRKFSADEKVKIIRKHLIEKVPISEVCDQHGINAEVIDLRSLKPMDIDTVAKSVQKTGKLVTVSEGFCQCGVGPEITRQYMDYQFEDGTKGFDYLDAMPINLAAEDVPPPNERAFGTCKYSKS